MHQQPAHAPRGPKSFAKSFQRPGVSGTIRAPSRLVTLTALLPRRARPVFRRRIRGSGYDDRRMGGKATSKRDVRALGIAVGLAALVLAIYGRLHGHEFLILDDDQYITNNGHVRLGLSAEGFRWAFTHVHAANWHPLTWLSHMSDWELFGAEPAGHHLVSVALHAANAVLLFFVWRTMTGALVPPSLVAALFAIHPLHVESVAWAAERKDVLSGLFWMTTLLAYAWYARRPGAGRYVTVLLSLAFGLMAKPMLVTLPFVLLLLDVWPLGRWPRPGLAADRPRFPARRPGILLLEKVPMLVLAAASSVLAVTAQHVGGSVSTFVSVPLGMRLANAVVSYAAYLGKGLWPARLAYFYPHPAEAIRLPVTFLVATAVSALLLAALTFFALRARSRPYLAVGWLWYLGTLVPVIGLVQVGGQAMADRYTYLPLIGIYVAVAWGLRDLITRRPAWVRGLATAVVLALAVLAVVSWRQAGTWKTNRTLFEHALRVTTDNYVAHTHLGTVLNAELDLDGAEAHYEEALRIRPGFADTHNGLGIVFGKRRDLDEAVRHFERAIAVAPEHPDAHHNLGLVYRSRGRLDDAAARFTEALRLRPDFVKALLGLGQIAEARGNLPEAAARYGRALEINPGYEPARTALERLSTRRSAPVNRSIDSPQYR
jgi:tetratricopeptide (TPR) repeat protein